MNKLSIFGVVLMGATISVSCSSTDADEPVSWVIGDPTTTDYPEDYYAGGLLGTTSVNTASAYQQPTKAVENTNMMTAFNEGGGRRTRIFGTRGTLETDDSSIITWLFTEG